MDAHGPLCVGIDPHQALLASWDLPDTPRGLRDFALRIVDAVGGRIAAVKPQSAFFERHGSAGIAVLEETLAALRAVGTLSILDVKRGDIGSTMSGYAQAYLVDGAPLAADAMTLSPYLGYDSLSPALELADASGRGVFVLALTSNPEGASVQHASTGQGSRSSSVAADVVAGAARSNAAARDANTLGSVGLVVLAFAESATGLAGIVVAFALVGFGIGLSMTLNTDAIVGAVPTERAGAASSIAETAYELGTALGIALLGSVHTALYRAALPSGTDPVIRDSLASAVSLLDPADPALTGAKHAFTTAMQWTSAIAAVLLAATAVLAWFTIPRTAPPGEEAVPEGTPRTDMERSVR